MHPDPQFGPLPISTHCHMTLSHEVERVKACYAILLQHVRVLFKKRQTLFKNAAQAVREQLNPLRGQHKLQQLRQKSEK